MNIGYNWFEKTYTKNDTISFTVCIVNSEKVYQDSRKPNGKKPLVVKTTKLVYGEITFEEDRAKGETK